jgi:hypothetical protein
MESQRSPGIFQQLRLVYLAYKLYALASRIDAIKAQLEVRGKTLLTYIATDEDILAGCGRTTTCIACWSERTHICTKSVFFFLEDIH